MDKTDDKLAVFEKQKEAIEKALLDFEMSEEKAKEIAFHLAEILPDFEAVSKGIEDGSLTHDEIANLATHLPYHARGIEENWFK